LEIVIVEIVRGGIEIDRIIVGEFWEGLALSLEGVIKLAESLCEGVLPHLVVLGVEEGCILLGVWSFEHLREYIFIIALRAT